MNGEAIMSSGMVTARKKRCSPKYHLVLQLWIAGISGLVKPIKENASLISNKMGTIPLVGAGDNILASQSYKGNIKIYKAFLSAEPKIISIFSESLHLKKSPIATNRRNHFPLGRKKRLTKLTFTIQMYTT